MKLTIEMSEFIGEVMQELSLAREVGKVSSWNKSEYDFNLEKDTPKAVQYTISLVNDLVEIDLTMKRRKK